jgi:hypothetical protein
VSFRHVRFAPIATEIWRRGESTWCAISGCEQLQQGSPLFDQFIGRYEQLVRHGEAEHPGGLVIDDQLDFVGLQDRQLHRFPALEDAAGIEADLTKRIRDAGSVAHQPADFSKVAVSKCRWDRVARRQVDQLGTPAI